MTRAFVTGATGQDGSYLVERLVEEGVEVHALALEPVHLPDVIVHVADLADADAVRRLLVDVAPEEVYHLAGVSSVALSWQQPALTATLNGTAVAVLLEAALQVQRQRDQPVRFVQASSAEIFGDAAVSPQDEDTPIRPVNPYGAAKAFAHHLVGVHRREGLHSVNAILYNHESPRRPTRFVTRKITSGAVAVSRGRLDRLRLGNLDAARDWGWAPDYVDAMVRAARAESADDYVVATGRAHTIADFAAAAFRCVGIEDWRASVEVDPALLRPSDPALLVGNAARARTRLGWSPTVGFEEIVRRMVEADLALAVGQPAQPSSRPSR